MAVQVDPVTDGRRARRERNRAAVIDAMFALLAEDQVLPTVDRLAERSGVSASSVFRYFESLDDLQQETIDRYFERFSPLFDVTPADDGTTLERIDVFVRARLDLYEATAPVARVARARALEQHRLAETLASTRDLLHRQVRRHFRTDLSGRRRAEVDERVALVDALTAFEAWDLLRSHHGRSRRQVHRAWSAGLEALLSH